MELKSALQQLQSATGQGVTTDNEPGGKITPSAHVGTWSDYQCWLALGALRGGRGAIVQRLVSPSTVSLLGYQHEQRVAL